MVTKTLLRFVQDGGSLTLTTDVPTPGAGELLLQRTRSSVAPATPRNATRTRARGPLMILFPFILSPPSGSLLPCHATRLLHSSQKPAVGHTLPGGGLGGRGC